MIKGDIPISAPPTLINMQDSSGGGSLRQRLGTLLQSLGGRTGSSSRPEEPWKPDQAAYLTEDILNELGPSKPLPLRLKALKELHEIVATKRLEQYALQALWLAVKDLGDPSQPQEARHAVFGFLRALIGGQFEELGILRAHFLRVAQNHVILEDFQPCFDVVCTLTDSGKNIQYMEEEIGPYLVQILPRAIKYGRSIEYLTMLVNMIKHNVACLEEDVLAQLVQGCCRMATSSNQLPLSELCLEAINTVICYSSLPSSTLRLVATTLCHTLNISRLQKQSLETMLRLLGTHMGHVTVYTLCSVLQESHNWSNALLLRGAVFYISMSLWGVRRVDSLNVSITSVLPAIQEVSKCSHTIVLYEIALSVLRLVRTNSHNFHNSEWDSLYKTMDHIQEHVKKLNLSKEEANKNVLVQVMHDIFKAMASYHFPVDYTHLSTDSKQFYNVVDKGTSLHPLPLVFKLLAHQCGSIQVGHTGWVKDLMSIMRRFYEREHVTAIRLEALDQLQNIVLNHLLCYESELLEGVVFPLLSSVGEDTDEDIRCKAIQLLIAVLNDSTSQWTPPILAIVNNVFQKGLQVVAMRTSDHEGEELKLPASKTAVFGLTPLFKSKLMSSSDVAAQVFQLLVTYLQQLYEEKCFVPATCVMRIKIFNCILSLRANEDGLVGYHDDEGTVFSPFYVCKRYFHQRENELEGDELLNNIFLDCNKVFLSVLNCIVKEEEWAVLVEVLVGLAKLLEDRTLITSSSPNLSQLCLNLCSITDNQSNWFNRLRNVPSRKPEDGLTTYLYPVLALLCTYGSHLDRSAQHALICCLERGVVGSSALLCVHAITIASLEMQSTMTRLLPRVLYRIGQVSATPTMAIPVLELLVGIIALRPHYSGFVEQQYLSVFGIALPYTDPSKYNSYVVALANHVISMWFIRCRIQYRPTIAKFINKSLTTLLSVNKDISPTDEPRKRAVSFSSSSTTAYNRQRSQTHSGGEEASPEDALMSEMIDVCIDMMARYTYSNISTQPIRSPAADFLVGGGPSKTWLIGNALVTITTSGTGGGVQGVCPRCKAIQQSLQPDPAVLLASNEYYLSSLHSSIADNVPVTLCSCWCRGWAEVKVRRPTGNVAWLMRVQNKLDILATPQTINDHDYDWSLMGLNRNPLDEEDEDEDEGKEEEWGILTLEQENEKSHDLVTCEKSHELVTYEKSQDPVTYEKSHDMSHDTPCKGISTTTELVISETQNETSPLTTSKRQPSSHSWSEKGEKKSSPISTTRSYSLSSASLEHLPPLFSYDESHLMNRSPSLVSGLLSDPEQLELMSNISQSSHNMSLGDHNEGGDSDAGSSSSEDQDKVDKITIIDLELVNKNDQSEEEKKLCHVTEQQSEDLHDVESLKEEIVEVERTQVTPLVQTTPPVAKEPHSSPSPKKLSSSSSSPSRVHKRVMFSQVSSPSSSIREDTSTDIFNNPSFIFLQLYHSVPLGVLPTDTPLLLPSSESVERAMKVLDHIPTYNTHKIGVVYVDQDQITEQSILSNTSGSSRYLTFLRGLGQLIKLRECSSNLVYLGGLDTSGIDGELACFWEDDITQVIFHVATLMPTHPNNPHCSNKKLHIGNDFVTIVYNNSQKPYIFGTIKGQFNYVEVTIEPLPCGMNNVSLTVKDGLATYLNCSPCLVSDKWLPLLVRQKALLANLASLVMLSESTTDYYPSNWLGRLRQIRHIRERSLSELQSNDKKNPPPSPTTTAPSIPDFTLFC